jgi:hypothetical protein
MAFRTLVALTLGIGTIGFASSSNPVTFKVNEPVSIAGVPPVTLAPGSYVLRTVESSSGGSVVQIMSPRRDYMYTTVVTIPAVRLQPEDNAQLLLAETPSGTPPALHYWFPPGETIGREFINPQVWAAVERSSAPKQLQYRGDGGSRPAAPSTDSYALTEAMMRIETGKLGAARDCFRRNYFLTRNREGAFASFLLALLMTDREEARASLDAVNRLDPERTRALSRLGVTEVVETLPSARKNLKSSRVRRFLMDLAMDRTDDQTARLAIVSFERHVLKGDSFPVEMALDRRREELAREKTRESRWVLAQNLIAKLNDCVKSLLNQVGALEYSVSAEATGRYGSVRFSVVLTQRRLNDLDAIVARSHRTICQRQTNLERLIAQRNAAISRELDSLRSSLRELDRLPASVTKSQFASLRNWESASAAGVSRDLMLLAETATLPYMRPSTVLRTNGGSVQINVAASITRLAEWAAL